MILIWLILILLLGGLAAWVAGYFSATAARFVSLLVLGLDALILAVRFSPDLLTLAPQSGWFAQVTVPWIPDLGISISLGIDGLSFWMVALTLFLGLISVLVSWSEITHRAGFFHLNLLWILAGILGVFLALDLFLFYFLWELMLVPMYFLIAIWGHENRTYAAIKFFIFTQVSGLFLLISILTLYFAHGAATGTYTFNFTALAGTALNPGSARLVLAGFLAAFLVKLPAVPLHTWLPDAHTQAPTAGSVILAGLMLKTGAYGLLRFVIPLFPGPLQTFSYGLLVLGVAGILYGALLAFAQSDVKRLVAYTSVSHMGFVLIGIAAGSQLAMDGVLIQMLAHGISTGALFVIAGLIQDRLQTRDLTRMGGLWALLPRMGALTLIFAVASLGLPGLGNFVGEFLILLGTWPVAPWITAAGTLGLIAATIYSLWMVQQIFLGRLKERISTHDLNLRESAVLGSLLVAIVWLGLYPSPVFRSAGPVLRSLQQPARIALDSGTYSPVPGERSTP